MERLKRAEVERLTGYNKGTVSRDFNEAGLLKQQDGTYLIADIQSNPLLKIKYCYLWSADAAEIRAQLNKVTLQLTTEKREKEAATLQLNAVTLQLDTLKRSNDATTSQLNDVTLQLEKLKNESVATVKELTQVKQERDGLLNVSKNGKTALEAEKSRLESELKDANAQKTRLEGENTTLKGQNGELQRQVKRLQGSSNELQGLRSELQGKVGELQGEVNKLQGLNEKLQRSEKELQGKVAELQRSKERLQGSGDELQRVSEELQRADEELQDVSSKLQRSEAALQRSNERQEELRNELGEKSKEVQNLSIELDSTKEHLTIATDKVESMQGDFEKVAELQIQIQSQRAKILEIGTGKPTITFAEKMATSRQLSAFLLVCVMLATFGFAFQELTSGKVLPPVSVWYEYVPRLLLAIILSVSVLFTAFQKIPNNLKMAIMLLFSICEFVSFANALSLFELWEREGATLRTIGSSFFSLLLPAISFLLAHLQSKEVSFKWHKIKAAINHLADDYKFDALKFSNDFRELLG